MKLDTMMEVLWAATMTHRVKSRFPSRGGIMLVAPPGQLKTSFLSCFDDQLGVLSYSDMTSTTLVEARDYIASKKVQTLVLYDMQKLYERRQDTAQNIVGNLRAMMDEGFTHASFEKQSHNVIQSKARALVLAACTPAFYRRQLSSWEESGFARRCLFAVFTLKDPSRIERAILDEVPIDIRAGAVSIPVNLEIDSRLRGGDEELLVKILGKQREDVPLNLMKKILCVLRWRYTQRLKVPDRSHEILREFGQCLSGGGAEIELGNRNGVKLK